LSGNLQYRISDKPLTEDEWIARHGDVAAISVQDFGKNDCR
jgi:hypothetical protein